MSYLALLTFPSSSAVVAVVVVAAVVIVVVVGVQTIKKEMKKASFVCVRKFL